ncbi:MAG TPA: MmgE/PrpD family protein [Pseudonocardiaceae bacterium]|jgi:2-methylcitrate dehydratase PrpD|nr:MmgE/PrpD family protein [Pseudonocardiaceae bacterium]
MALRASQVTERLAAYARSTDFDKLPEEVVDRAKRVIADELGCMVLGATMPPGERMRSFVASIGGHPRSSVVGGGIRVPAGYAALANGTSSHSDELDGVHVSQGHPAGTSVAGALAVCEQFGLGGRDLINAVVLSFDVGCRVLIGIGGGHAVRRERHVHGSPLYSLGVATAAGRLLDLDRLGIQYAMALAILNISVPASFYDERNHMSKAMNQGQAAYAGVTGALLAGTGFEGHERIMEAKDGLIDGWRTGRTDVEAMTAGLGESYSIMDAGMKYYSAGYPINSPLAGAFALMTEHGIAADDVAKVRVGMAPASADVVDNRPMPSICLQDMLSVGMVLGRLRYEDAHEPANLARPDVRRLRATIEIVRDDSLAKDAAARRVSWVEITTRNGRTYRGPERIAPGHWELGGMPWDDLGEKFASLVDPRLGPEATQRILAFVRDLENHDDLGPLGAALSGSPVRR